MASSTEELLSIARSGFKEIGYQEELLRSGYQFADFLSPSCPVREIQLAGFAQQPRQVDFIRLIDHVAADPDHHGA